MIVLKATPVAPPHAAFELKALEKIAPKAGMICLKLTMMIVTDPRMKHTTMKGTIFSATDAIL